MHVYKWTGPIEHSSSCFCLDQDLWVCGPQTRKVSSTDYAGTIVLASWEKLQLCSVVFNYILFASLAVSWTKPSLALGWRMEKQWETLVSKAKVYWQSSLWLGSTVCFKVRHMILQTQMADQNNVFNHAGLGKWQKRGRAMKSWVSKRAYISAIRKL